MIAPHVTDSIRQASVTSPTVHKFMSGRLTSTHPRTDPCLDGAQHRR